MTPRRALALGAGCLTAVAGLHTATGGEVEPGAYCPLPKPGATKPTCLAPAEAEYGEFFEALGEDGADDADLARVEQDLAQGADSGRAYLALSSLAYGYYALSQRAAAGGEVDAAIARRLERWNDVLGDAYARSEGDETFRRAVREAALDLQHRAPPVRVACLDERGIETQCASTDVIVRGLDDAAGQVGIRGGLRRLLERWLGSDES